MYKKTPDGDLHSSSNIRVLKICKSGLKCSCDLERELYELRPVRDTHYCVQCHDLVAFVRIVDHPVLKPFWDLEAAFWQLDGGSNIG